MTLIMFLVDDALYILVALLLFMSLFTIAPIPKSLDSLKNGVLGVEWTVFKIARWSGFVTDATMCVLNDLWSTNGMEVTYRTPEGNYKNTSCALLTENKIAITPKDEDVFGSELGGVATEFTVTNKWVVNRLFYFSYVMFGTVLMLILKDFFTSTGIMRTHTIMSNASIITISIGLITVTLRTNTIGGMRTWSFFGHALGQSTSSVGMISIILTLLLAMAAIMFAFHQVVEGYNIAKETYRAYSGLQTAVKADLERGKKAQEIAEKQGKV